MLPTSQAATLPLPPPVHVHVHGASFITVSPEGQRTGVVGSRYKAIEDQISGVSPMGENQNIKERIYCGVIVLHGPVDSAQSRPTSYTSRWALCRFSHSNARAKEAGENQTLHTCMPASLRTPEVAPIKWKYPRWRRQPKKGQELWRNTTRPRSPHGRPPPSSSLEVCTARLRTSNGHRHLGDQSPDITMQLRGYMKTGHARPSYE